MIFLTTPPDKLIEGAWGAIRDKNYVAAHTLCEMAVASFWQRTIWPEDPSVVGMSAKELRQARLCEYYYLLEQVVNVIQSIPAGTRT